MAAARNDNSVASSVTSGREIVYMGGGRQAASSPESYEGPFTPLDGDTADGVLCVCWLCVCWCLFVVVGGEYDAVKVHGGNYAKVGGGAAQSEYDVASARDPSQYDSVKFDNDGEKKASWKKKTFK